MKILLIGTRESSENPEAYYEGYRLFFENAARQVDADAKVFTTLTEDLYVAVGDGEIEVFDTKTGSPLKDFDYVFLRGKGFRARTDMLKAISVYCRLHNVRVVNDYSGFRDSSKLTQAVQFLEQSIPVAKTVYVNEALLHEKHDAGIEFPCIMKATLGAHGEDNYLVKSLQEVKEIAATNEKIFFVLQRFIKNDGDFRLLVVGENVLVIGREATEGSHLNNTSQGGKAVLASTDDIPETVIDDARKITRSLNMTIAGVDVIQDVNTKEYYFLEVNSQPQLQTGAFVEKKAELLSELFSSVR